MTTELKPCPFCGEPAMWCKNNGDAGNLNDIAAGGEWVQCSKCLCSTTMRYSLMDDCRPLLAEAWNKRVEPKPVAQVVAVDPPGPDGHQVNWLAGKRPKPGALLYAAT